MKILYRIKLKTLREFFYRIVFFIYTFFTDYTLNRHFNNYNFLFYTNYFLGNRATKYMNEKSQRNVRFFNALSIVNPNLINIYKFDLSLSYNISETDKFDLLKPWMKSNILDFGLFKLDFYQKQIYSGEVFMSLIAEIRDLVLPHLYNFEEDYNNSFIGEGTYITKMNRIQSTDVVIDVGANFGVFSLYAASLGAEVIAFEPVSLTRKIFNKNLSINNDIQLKIKLEPIGLSNTSGIGTIFINNRNLGGSSLKPLIEDTNDWIEEEITINTLDNYVKENRIKKIDFIKVDIEGLERDFLYGALESIKEFRPIVSICTYHKFDDPIILKDILIKANPNYKFIYVSRKMIAYE